MNVLKANILCLLCVYDRHRSLSLSFFPLSSPSLFRSFLLACSHSRARPRLHEEDEYLRFCECISGIVIRNSEKRHRRRPVQAKRPRGTTRRVAATGTAATDTITATATATTTATTTYTVTATTIFTCTTTTAAVMATRGSSTARQPDL